MSRFVEVTNHDDNILYIAVDHIIMIRRERLSSPEYTILVATDCVEPDDHYHIKETPKEIMHRIGEAMP